MEDLDLGYLLAVTAACVRTPRPLTTWFELLGTARAIAAYASSDPSGPPAGAEPLRSDALARLRVLDDDSARRMLDDLRRSGCGARTKWDPDYPSRLLDLRDPPLVIYLRGDLAVLRERCVAIVGSRAASSYGRRAAAAMAAEFGAYGATVVSGFARGIDAAAHRGALESGTRTVAVPGSGLCALYPEYHKDLADEIVARGGAIVTEFPPAMSARPHHFPMRNRIVAALADATVVVEAKERSGALITARLADEFGRAVFAIPGDVDRPTSVGTNALIKDGVGLVTSAADIASLMRWEPIFGSSLPDSERPLPCDRTHPVIAALNGEACDSDELAERLNLSAAEVAAQLTVLEIQGLVERRAGGAYAAVQARRLSNANAR